MYRGRKHKPFSEADRKRYKLLMPHLSRALGMQFRLRDAEHRVAASLAALEGLGAAALLVGAGGEIVFANRAALALLAEGDGLRLRSLGGRNRWRLVAEHGATQAKIDAALRQAADADSLTAAHFSRAIPVPRPSGLAPYALQLSALPQGNAFGAGGGGAIPRAILFVADSARPAALDGATLTHLFGLTAGEARLAEVLGAGMGLQEAADALEVSHNTAKSQLQQVYQKTGADNRARLMKLLMTLAQVKA